MFLNRRFGRAFGTLMGPQSSTTKKGRKRGGKMSQKRIHDEGRTGKSTHNYMLPLEKRKGPKKTSARGKVWVQELKRREGAEFS